ncbi:UNVERIFIED_CONTAM: hypothetical protein HDU68_004213, partial [Siphonaria sp. JEL0065]
SNLSLSEMTNQCATTGKSIDVYTFTTTFTFNAILFFVFGSFPNQVIRIQNQFDNFRVWIGGLGDFWIPQWMNGPFAKSLRAKKVISRVILEIMNERRGGTSGEPAFQDGLSKLMEAKDEFGQQLSDNEIIENIMVFVFAGHDTTSATISSAIHYWIYEMSDLERSLLSEEVESSFPETEAELLQLPVLDAFIKEVLRVKAPIPGVMRRLACDVELYNKTIPKDTIVHVPIAALMRNSQVFENPAEFKLERFLADDSIPAYTCIPFSFGARQCLGMTLAILEKLCSKCLDHALQLNGKIVSLCSLCFNIKTSLNMNVQVEEIGTISSPSTQSILFVHGGGGCRKMFAPHARILADRGFHCILMDLPGHGAAEKSALSLDSAVASIIKHASLANNGNGTKKPIIVGGSLGGYLAIETIGRHPTVFSKAVIMMCGQNVGAGRGWMAGLGLSFLNLAVNSFSPTFLLSGMASQAKSNGHISESMLSEIAMDCGFFFNQGKQQIEILQATDSARWLSKFNGPVLVLDGSKDHHDSHEKWINACGNRAEAKGNLYEGGDHFFSHDDRFFGQVVNDILAFIS